MRTVQQNERCELVISLLADLLIDANTMKVHLRLFGEPETTDSMLGPVVEYIGYRRGIAMEALADEECTPSSLRARAYGWLASLTASDSMWSGTAHAEAVDRLRKKLVVLSAIHEEGERR